MRVHLGSDHAGFALKSHLVAWLTAGGHEPVDHGAVALDPEDDYPGFCIAAAAATVADPGSLGVVIGGSGNGEAIAANKVPGARCALVWNAQTAELARAHNDANLASLGARMHSVEEATGLLAVFLATPFTGEPRHRRRISQLSAYEETRAVPAAGAG